MPAEEYPKHLKFDFISTFDIKDKDINTQQTYLDKRLVRLQSDYGYYLNGLQKQFTSYLNKQGSVTKELYDKIYTRKTLFENLVNGAFKETGKVIDNESEKLRFIIDGKTSIEASQLSSGEKQLLIILLTVLLEDGREYVLMMDEPEISLHISWQYELLNWILELNPNVQLILTTHSPSIFSDGWGDKAIYMEDITTKK
jgi:predicted ATP-dependent endonuclease of OLD family